MSEQIYRWVEPGENDEAVMQEITRDGILRTYWPWWSAQMLKVGRILMATEDCCVDDFVVVHWAERVEVE
jgi:hypothetical protein